MNTLKMDRSQLFEGPTHEQIQTRAYELYLARGGTSGNEHEDWVQAERELTEAAAASPVAPAEQEPVSSKKDHRGDRGQGRGHRVAGDRASQRH